MSRSVIYHLPMLVLAAVLLIGCGGSEAATVVATMAMGSGGVPTPAADTIGCMLNVRVAPASGIPAVTQTEAETQVRARFNPSNNLQRGELGPLLEARHITVTASDQPSEVGQPRWLLVFVWVPPAPQPAQFPIPGMAYRTFAFADATTGLPLNSCSSAVPVSATPTP